MTGKFEIYKDRNGDYRFRFRAANGQIVAEGSPYPTKAEAKRAVPQSWPQHPAPR